MKTPDISYFEEHINSIDSDFRAEVVAAELVENGFNLDRLFIVHKGASRRAVSKDIAGVYFDRSSEFDLKDYLQIKVNRDGLYDILPEGVFHQPIYRKEERNKDKVIEEMRIHRRQEVYARKFFQPFETEINRALILAQLYENRFDKPHLYRDFVNVFRSYWPVIERLDTRKAIIFLNMIPLLRTLRVDFEKAAQYIGLILDTQVVISKHLMPQDVKKDKSICLGKYKLGVNFVLGNKFTDGQEDIEIVLGPMPGKQMELFIEGRQNHIILNTLCEMLLPAYAHVNIRYKIDRQQSVFSLSGNGKKSYLGINTFLGERKRTREQKTQL